MYYIEYWWNSNFSVRTAGTDAKGVNYLSWVEKERTCDLTVTSPLNNEKETDNILTIYLADTRALYAKFVVLLVRLGKDEYNVESPTVSPTRLLVGERNTNNFQRERASALRALGLKRQREQIKSRTSNYIF